MGFRFNKKKWELQITGWPARAIAIVFFGFTGSYLITRIILDIWDWAHG